MKSILAEGVKETRRTGRGSEGKDVLVEDTGAGCLYLKARISRTLFYCI